MMTPCSSSWGREHYRSALCDRFGARRRGRRHAARRLPDAFLAYSSNAFAVVGLRSLYFALAGMLDAFHYLRYGFSAILAFVGAKMMLDDIFPIKNGVVLAVVGGALLCRSSRRSSSKRSRSRRRLHAVDGIDTSNERVESTP